MGSAPRPNRPGVATTARACRTGRTGRTGGACGLTRPRAGRPGPRRHELPGGDVEAGPRGDRPGHGGGLDVDLLHAEEGDARRVAVAEAEAPARLQVGQRIFPTPAGSDSAWRHPSRSWSPSTSAMGPASKATSVPLGQVRSRTSTVSRKPNSLSSLTIGPESPSWAVVFEQPPSSGRLALVVNRSSAYSGSSPPGLDDDSRPAPSGEGASPSSDRPPAGGGSPARSPSPSSDEQAIVPRTHSSTAAETALRTPLYIAGRTYYPVPAPGARRGVRPGAGR